MLRKDFNHRKLPLQTKLMTVAPKDMPALRMQRRRNRIPDFAAGHNSVTERFKFEPEDFFILINIFESGR